MGLTEFSKHHLVREPTAAECRAAIALVEERAAIALRGAGRATGPSARTSCTSAPAWSCPPAQIYDGFEQVENGVGAVRWLQRRIARRVRTRSPGWEGQRVGVVTGTAMGRLMPMVLEPLAARHRRDVRAASRW